MDKRLLVAGLLLPGLGSLLRGRLAEAVIALWTVAFFLAIALVDLAVWNGAGPYSGATGRTFDVTAILVAVPMRMIVPPTVPLVLVLALTAHLLAAVGGARNRPESRDVAVP